MSRRFVLILVALLSLSLAVAGCSQTAPAAAPTTAATQPAKAAESTKPAAPAAQPIAAAPAKKADFPQNGKTINIIVPFAAGGSTDSATRMLAPLMEKDLGVPVQIVDKAGASTQIGAADLVASKPDGYNLLMFALPTTLITYLDPERKAGYTRKDFQPIAMAFSDGLGIAVPTDSRFKTAKDVVEAAKENPGNITMGTSGLLGLNHLGMVAWEKQSGIKFAYVHFNSGLEAITASLGGHLDVASATLGNVQPQFKNGTVRVLGILEKEQSDLLPGAPTLESQGYPVFASAAYILVAPAGTPKDVVDVINAAVKKAATSPEYKTKVNEIGMSPKYMDADQASAYWADRETETKPLLDAAK